MRASVRRKTPFDLRVGLGAYSKAKHILGKTGDRTKEAPIESMGRTLGAVSAEDVRGYFAHCGYLAPAQRI